MPRHKADTIKSKASLLSLDSSMKDLPRCIYWEIAAVQRSVGARIGDILAIKLQGDIDNQGYWKFAPQKQKRQRSLEQIEIRTRALKQKSKERKHGKKERKQWFAKQVEALHKPLPQKIITKRFPAIAREIIRRRQALALPGQVYLFPSPQPSKVHRPITRQAYHNNLKQAAAGAGLRENVASHSMRKSAAYQVWKETKGDAARTASFLYQNGVDSVEPYIGVTEDETDRLAESIAF